MDFDKAFLYSMKESAIMSGVQENDIILMLSFATEYPGKIPEYIRDSETGEIFFTGENVSEIKPCYERFAEWLEKHYDEHGRRRYIKEEEEEDIEVSLDSDESTDEVQEEETDTDSIDEVESEDFDDTLFDDSDEDDKKKKSKKHKTLNSNSHDELLRIEKANKEIERLTKERNAADENRRLEEEKRINAAIKENERIIQESQERLYAESQSKLVTDNDKAFLDELSNKYKELEDKRIAQEKAIAETAKRLEESRASLYAGADNLSGEQFYTKAEEYEHIDFSFVERVAAGDLSTQTAVEVDRVLKGLDFSGEGNHYSEEQARAETEKLLDAIEQDSINRRIIEGQQAEISHTNENINNADIHNSNSYPDKDTYHQEKTDTYQHSPETTHDDKTDSFVKDIDHQYPSDTSSHHAEQSSYGASNDTHEPVDHHSNHVEGENQAPSAVLYDFHGDFNEYSESQVELLHTLKTQADELQNIYKKEAELYKTHSEYIIESAMRDGDVSNLYNYEKEQINSSYQKSEEAFSRTEEIYSYIKEKEDRLYIDEARYKATKAAEKYDEGINYNNYIQYDSQEAERIKSANLSKQYTDSLNRAYTEASDKIQNYYNNRERIVSFSDMELLEKERLNATRTKEYELIAKQDIYGIKNIDTTLSRDEQIRQIKEIHELSNERRAQATQKYNELLYDFGSTAAVSATDYLRQQAINDIRAVIKDDENKDAALSSTIGSWETIQLNEARRAFDFQQKQNASFIDTMSDSFKDKDKNSYTVADSNRDGTLTVQKSAITANAIEAKNLDTYNRAQAQAILTAYIANKSLDINQTPASVEALRKETFNKLSVASENTFSNQTNCVKNFTESLNTLNRQRIPTPESPTITVLDTPDKIYAEFDKIKKGYEKATKKIFFGAYEQNNNIAFGSSILNELDDFNKADSSISSDKQGKTGGIPPANTFGASRNSDLQPGSKTPNKPSDATAEVTYERGSLLNTKALENIVIQARRSINTLGESAILGTDLGSGLNATVNFVKVPLAIASALAIKSYLHNFNTVNIINQAANYANLSADMSLYINAKIKSNLADPGAIHFSKKQIEKMQKTPPLLQKDALSNVRDMVSARFKDKNKNKLKLEKYTKKQLKDLINDEKVPAVLREAAKFELSARDKIMAKKSLGKNKTTLRMFIKSGSRLLMSDDAAGDGYSTVQRLTRVVKTTTQTAYRAARLSSSIINKASGDAFKKLDAEVKQAIVRNTREHVINPVKKQINKGATQLNKRVVKPVTTAAKKVGKQASTRITSTSAFTSARARINSTKAGFNRIKTKFSGSKIGRTTAKTGKTLAKGAKTTAKIGQKAAKAMTTVAAKIGETVASFISKVNKITLIIAAVIACIILLLLVITTVGHAMVGLLTGISDDTTNKDETYISKAYDSITTLEGDWNTMLANSYNDKKAKAKDLGITGYNDLSKYTKTYYEGHTATESPDKYSIQSWGDKAPDASDYSTNAQLISNWNGDGYRVTPGLNGSISNIKTILSVADYKQSIAVAVQSDNAAAGANFFVKDFSGKKDYENYCSKVFKNTHFRYMSYSDLYTCNGSGDGCGEFLWYCNDTEQAHKNLQDGNNSKIILYDKNDLKITKFKKLPDTEWFCGTSEPNHYKCSGCQDVVCYDGTTRKGCPGHPYLGAAPSNPSDAEKANPRGTFVSDTDNDGSPNTAIITHKETLTNFFTNNWLVNNSSGTQEVNENNLPKDVVELLKSEGILGIKKPLVGNPYYVLKVPTKKLAQTTITLSSGYTWITSGNGYKIIEGGDAASNYINENTFTGSLFYDRGSFSYTIAPNVNDSVSFVIPENDSGPIGIKATGYHPYHTLYSSDGTVQYFKERCTSNSSVLYYCVKTKLRLEYCLIDNNGKLTGKSSTSVLYFDVNLWIPYSCSGCTYDIEESHRIGYYTYCPGHTGTYCHGHTKLLVDGVTMYASDNINSDKLDDFTTWEDNVKYANDEEKKIYSWNDKITGGDVPIGFKIQLNGTSSACTTNLWESLSGFESDYSDPRYPDFINWMYTSVESQGSSEYIIDNAPVIRQKEEDDWGTDYYGINLSNNTYNRRIDTSQFITNNIYITCPDGSKIESSKKFFSVDQLK